MPTPKTHYRVALGEHSGEHSWIIHSAKGIKWHNISNDLASVLQQLSVNDLLDFALGSGGRWYVRYRHKGLERQALSPNLWVELGQGSDVKLDRLTLGPDADNWGVHKVAGGSFQRFSSPGNRDRFTRLLDSNTQNIKSNNQIGFVSLGFNGDWAFRVNGHVEHRCGKPFHIELAGGWKTRKRVSTIVLSPMARVWIILWEDGILSHNLPSNISTEVEDYCQLQHSLIQSPNLPDSGRPNTQHTRHQQHNQPQKSSFAQGQHLTTNPTHAVNPLATQTRVSNTTESSSARQTTNDPLKVTPNPAPALSAPSHMPPTGTVLSVPRPPRLLASTLIRQPVTMLSSTQFPPQSTQSPKAPFIVKPGPEHDNSGNTTQLPCTHQTTTSLLNATLERYALVQKPATKAALARPSKSIRAPKALSTVKPVQATVFASEPASQMPLTRAVSKRPEIYDRPKKLLTTLRLLDPSSWPDSAEYEKIARHFKNGWTHQHKAVPSIKRIFAVCLPDCLNETYEEYNDLLERRNGWRGANEQLVFHGTQRRCILGEGDEYSTLCQREDCRLCCILQSSFLVSKAGSAGRSFKRFGPGIYTSSVSSKADDYTISSEMSNIKAMIIAKVSLGKVSVHYRNTQHLRAPPVGYDSVLGDVGVDLNYNEQVLYKNEAVRPAYVVIYAQPVVSGFPTYRAPRSTAQIALSHTAAKAAKAAAATAAATTMTTSTTGSFNSPGCTIM